MKFRYKRIASDVDPAGYTLHPLIQVSLRYGNRAIDIRALIDSGAADCLFHRSIGETLGIDIESGRPKDYMGIARQSVVGYVHEIGLRVQGAARQVRCALSSFVHRASLNRAQLPATVPFSEHAHNFVLAGELAAVIEPGRGITGSQHGS